MLDTESKRDIPVLQNPGFNLYSPVFSPDERWIAFHARTPRIAMQQYIAPFRGERSIPGTEWIEVGEGGTPGGTPQWSPDGDSFYSISERDGFKCLWWQQLERGAKRPLGAPISIEHFHRARVSLNNFAVARDKLALSISELSGNIWMTNLDGTP